MAHNCYRPHGLTTEGLLLLLLLLLLFITLCRVFQLHTWTIVLQLFCNYNWWYTQCYFARYMFCTFTLVLSEARCPIWLLSVVPWCSVIIIIIIIIIMLSLVTGLFYMVLLFMNLQWSSALRLQISDCNTFRIMCDDPSIAVFGSESTECFSGQIRCISIHKPLYFIFYFVLHDISVPMFYYI